jgi:hypothetical protein
MGVVEATPASVGVEKEPFSEVGIPLVQVNTGGRSQLDASALNPALKQLPLASIDILLLENIGNLVCHGKSQLGLQADVLMVSVPQGHDNPYKYPESYRHIDAVILNKTDLLPWVSFDLTLPQGSRTVEPKRLHLAAVLLHRSRLAPLDRLAGLKVQDYTVDSGGTKRAVVYRGRRIDRFSNPSCQSSRLASVAKLSLCGGLAVSVATTSALLAFIVGRCPRRIRAKGSRGTQAPSTTIDAKNYPIYPNPRECRDCAQGR